MARCNTHTTAASTRVLVPFSALALILTSCISSNPANNRSATQQNSVAGLKSQYTPENELSERLIASLPDSLTAAEDFEKSDHGRRITTLLGRGLTDTNKQTLVSLRALLLSQREIREQRPAQARELGKVILATPNLSTEVYTSALRKIALADVLSLTTEQTNADTELGARDPRAEFNSFQNLQCSIACKSMGWEVLTREEPNLFGVNGYRTRLLSEPHFKRAGLTLPPWLRNIWSQSVPRKKEIVFDDAQAATDTALSRVLKMRTLVDNRQWDIAAPLAKKVLSQKKPKATPNSKVKVTCPADFIYAQYVSAQVSRIQQDRKTFAQWQAQLMTSLEQNSCQPENFGLDKEQFDSFRLDARLWLARLQWEQNENPQAFHSARLALNEATALQSWEHYIDAAKILIGRVGFEMLNPHENIAFLNSLEKQSQSVELDEFPDWLGTRKGLLHFLEGDFSNSQKEFEKVVSSTTDNFTRAMAFYWMGRNSKARNDTTISENSFLSSGRTDPLSIYDIFSGQILSRESGRASTDAKRAFISSWREVHDSWMQIPKDKPLRILNSITPRNPDSPKSEIAKELALSQQQFDLSLESALLLLATLRASEPNISQDEFLTQLRKSDELLPHLLRAETANLRSSFSRLNTLYSEVLPRAHQIAWLSHALGDYPNSILFVGRLRDSIGWDTDYLPFLYFIFYPRPHLNEFQAAANRCAVDIDVLYSVARQESLFQASVKSPVGAVGLMQLMPTTAQRILKQLPEFQNGQKIDLTDPATNTLAGACYLRDLLARYQNNLAYAVAAYNAGEAAVDKWIARRQKIADVPFFIEFIPFAETKTYVQRVLRNYYNIKWIYQDPEPK
jgi:hypothetical protein